MIEWPTIYVVEDSENRIEYIEDLLKDLTWLDKTRNENNYDRPWRMYDEEDPFLESTWPSAQVGQILRENEWDGIPEDHIEVIQISEVDDYKHAEEKLQKPEPDSYLLLDLKYKQGSSEYDEIKDHALEIRGDIAKYEKDFKATGPGNALGEIFLNADESTRCLIATSGATEGLGNVFSDKRVRSALPAKEKWARRVVFDLLMWILESEKSPLERLREAADNAAQSTKDNLMLSIDGTDIPHGPENVCVDQCKAVREIVGNHFPYETDERGNLRQISELLHEGIKTIASAEVDFSSISMPGILTVAAIALASEGKKLAFSDRADVYGEAADINEFENSILNGGGAGNFDIPKTLYRFFKRIIEHTEDDNKEGLEDVCFSVEERYSPGGFLDLRENEREQSSNGETFLGVEFKFGDWPLQDRSKPRTLADSVLWHIMCKEVRGSFEGSQHFTSGLLAKCVWRVGAIFVCDIGTESSEIIYRPKNQGAPNTVFRFAPSGLQILSRTED